MVNLTLPSFPFVVAFAVTALGWKAGAVGLMASLPHICNFLQPLLIAVIARRFSTYAVLQVTFTLGAISWLMAPLFPSLGAWCDGVFAVILVVATACSSLATVSWSAAISEVVPERLAGRYFARRNLIFGTWTLLAVMVAGQLAEWNHNSLRTFGLIFGVAGLSRLTGLFFLSRMHFPPAVTERNPRGISLREFLSVLADQNYLWLCLFVGFWGLLLNAAMPFYTVFLVSRLGFGIGEVIKLTTLASLGGLVTLKGWGRLTDRFGHRVTLQAAALIWAATALIMWSMAHPGWTAHLYVGYFVVGATTAGFQLAQFNLMVQLAPACSRASYVAVFTAITSLFTAVGPVLGGLLLKWSPPVIGHLFHVPVSRFHLLFVLSALGCAVAANLVARVGGQVAQPVTSVWREMRTMRSFNPMLSVMAVGEVLLTPRGLVALGRRSLRTVRQQVKALEDVGGEIVQGVTEIRHPKEEE